MKVTVVSTDEFVIYLEKDNGFVFIHCDVLVKWTKQVKKHLMEKFTELALNNGTSLYALHSPDDSKHEKFLKLYGFSYLQSIIGLDNNHYDIYVWR